MANNGGQMTGHGNDYVVSFHTNDRLDLKWVTKSLRRMTISEACKLVAQALTIHMNGRIYNAETLEEVTPCNWCTTSPATARATECVNEPICDNCAQLDHDKNCDRVSETWECEAQSEGEPCPHTWTTEETN